MKSPHARAAIILLSSTLALVSFGCSQDNAATPQSPSATPVSASPPAKKPPTASAKQVSKPASTKSKSPAKTPSKPQLSPQAAADAYVRAIDSAESASSISLSAQSKEDWQLVISSWQQAIAFMKTIPASSPYHAIAKTKIPQYQRNLTYAQNKANPPKPKPQPVVVAKAPTGSSKPRLLRNGVYQAPIKRREGGTPVIDVTFDGNQTFEMIVDTGASGTLITRRMASALRVVAVSSAKAQTPNGVAEFPLGYVKSIGVSGAIKKNVLVAIALPDMEVGLLGHDFFEGYDITIKRNVVEFRPN